MGIKVSSVRIWPLCETFFVVGNIQPENAITAIYANSKVNFMGLEIET